MSDDQASSIQRWGIRLALAAVLFVGGGVGVFVFLILTDTDGSYVSSETGQVLLLTLLVVLLLICLLGFAVVLRLLRPGVSTSALGLPDGSVSAVIALTVLILFALSSGYVYKTMADSEEKGTVSTGLTMADVQRLPEDRVLEIDREPGTAPATYSVKLVKPDGTSSEVGRTTLATLSTLLVAIVGFYFGQRAIERGVERGQDGEARKQEERRAQRLEDQRAADQPDAQASAAPKTDTKNPAPT